MATELTKQAEEAQPQRYLKPYYEVGGDELAYNVTVYVPGVGKKGVNLSLEKGELLVEADRTHRPNQNWKAAHREIPEADYRLRLQLNVDIDESKISAKVEDGILRIELPVAEEAKPRTISVD